MLADARQAARATTASAMPASPGAAAAPASTRRSSPTSKTSSAASATCSASANVRRRRRRGGPQRGADLRYDLEISFEESAKGTETTIQIPRQETCETCRGTARPRAAHRPRARSARGRGQLRYPAGLLHGRPDVRRSAGARGRIITKPCPTCHGAGRVAHDAQADRQDSRRASPPASGCVSTARAKPGRRADLRAISMWSSTSQEHEFFQRDGNDLTCEIPLNFTTLALGGEIEVPTIDGDETFKIPEGTQTGTAFPAAQQRDAGRIRPRTRGPRSSRHALTPAKAESRDSDLCSRNSPRRCPRDKVEPHAPRSSRGQELFDKVKDLFG